MSETPANPPRDEVGDRLVGDGVHGDRLVGDGVHDDGVHGDSTRTQAPGLGDRATGDIVIDSALQDLRGAPADDLDAQIEAGRRVHRTLQGRLSDLGGE